MKKNANRALERLEKVREANLLGGGEKHTQRQHDRGKLTARERLDLLFDAGTFNELGCAVNSTGRRIDGREVSAPCDGAIIGTGRVDGRPVAAYASDFTVLGGSVGVQHGLKFIKLLEYAGKWRIPMVWLLDSSGGRLGYKDVPQGGIDWWFLTESRYSGVIPQINVLMGPCIAGQAYCPALCDFLLMSRGTAHLWLGGPRMTQAATSEKIADDVGGADYHMAYSGTCDLVGDNDREAVALARRLLSYLPSHCDETPPVLLMGDHPQRETPSLAACVPEDPEEPYDVRQVIREIADGGEVLEIKPDYAPAVVTAFARLNGKAVGFAAHNPQAAGVFDIDACDKVYRFLQTLDAFNLPFISLVDAPGQLPGQDQEAKGLLRHMAKVVDVYAHATIPKVALVLRNGFSDSGAFLLGGVRGLGADLVYAWPGARFAVEASRLDYAKAYGRGVEPEALAGYAGRSREIVDAFDAARSWSAQAVDEIIHPADTRKRLIEALEITKNKREEIPLRAKNQSTNPT